MFIRLLLLMALLLLSGCMHHKAPNMIVSSPVCYGDDCAAHADVVKMKWALRWRCTVGTRYNTWHSDGDSLVTAQTKAKQLCELLSGGHGVCRYKGCVQVESR